MTLYTQQQVAEKTGLTANQIWHEAYRVKTLKATEHINQAPLYDEAAIAAMMAARSDRAHNSLSALKTRGLCTGAQAARHLGITRQRFSAMVKSGAIHAAEIEGHRRLYALAQIETLRIQRKEQNRDNS
jgi:predicted XRE-type DNA-binding protein